MITNIVMLTYGRPRLTEQALRTLRENTPANMYTLTAFDDQGNAGTGGARNWVIGNAQTFGRGKYLYLSDNDVAFLPTWLDILTKAYEFGRKHLKVGALGGYCHPYHRPYEHHNIPQVSIDHQVGLTWALPTQSMLMSWEIWDKYGPFVETPPGKVGQSEDWNFTERLRADGLRVGAVYPNVVINTGRTDSFGKLAIGHEFVEDVPGLIVE